MTCCCSCRYCGRFKEGEPDIGTVLAFRKTFPASSRVFGYVALRAGNGRWYLTASSTNHQSSPMSWDALQKFIGNEACSKVLTWEDIP